MIMVGLQFRRGLDVQNSFTPILPTPDAQTSVVSIRSSPTPTRQSLSSSTVGRGSSSTATPSSQSTSRQPSSTLPLTSSTEVATPTTTDDSPASTTTITQEAVLPPTSTASKPSSTSNSFLSNKPVAGAVFGIAGLIILILFVIVVTYGIRRTRRNRLESMSFDPDVTSNSHLIETGFGTERRRFSQVDASSGQSPGDSSYQSATVYPGPPPPFTFPQQQQTQQKQQQQSYYNAPQQLPTWSQQPSYDIPSTLMSGYYVNRDTIYNGPVPAPPAPVYTGTSHSGPRRNQSSSNSLSPSATMRPRSMTQEDAINASPPSPLLPNPYANMPLPSPPGGQKQSSAAPLPQGFGSDETSSIYSNGSVEADARFWGNTLRVANQ